MSEKKVVSKKVAFALGIICVVLAALLVGSMAHFTSIVTDKDKTIASLNSKIADLKSKIEDLNNIICLVKSTVWVDDQTVSQPAGSYTYWTFSIEYAGYIVVTVHTSTTDNTYVRVIWSSCGVNYDESITVGVSGTAVFPVLPAPSIEVRIGNTNWFSGATETVSITYYY